jgi:acyl-CoA thioesterase I
MNPVVIYFLDGTAYVAGMATVAVALWSLLIAKNKWVRAGVTAAALGGFAVVLASGAPLPLWMYAVWLVFCLPALWTAYQAPTNKALVDKTVVQLNTGSLIEGKSSKGAEWGFVMVATLMTWLAVDYELTHRLEPKLPVEKNRAVYVIGDSISAGTGKDTPWPALLAQKTGLKVVNLAQAGATTQMAIKQAQRVNSDAALVIVEIGGNDLLGKTSVAEFETHLDTLVGGLKSQGFQVVVLELPCVPFKSGFGRAIRNVAFKNGAATAPRHLLVNALSTPGGTTDGLHLSEKGHAVMAEGISRILLISQP